MKKLFAFFAVFIAVSITAHSQNFINRAPAGFDSLRSDIVHGKMDTISYNSKTVGNNRKVLILRFGKRVFTSFLKCCSNLLTLSRQPAISF
jgi:hypothetical protein